MKDLVIYAPSLLGTPFFSIVEVEEMPWLVSINCAGNSAGTAAFFGGIPGKFMKVIVNASFVDASNFGLQISNPYIPGTSNPSIPVEYEIFSNGPNGDSITVYLATGTFVDGSTSVSIPCGQGKIIREINDSFSSPIYGIIG